MAAATQNYGNLLRLLLLWLVVSTCIQATTTTTTTITTTPITSRRPHQQGLLLNRQLTTNDKNNQDPACWRSDVYNPNADADHKQRVVGKHGLVFYLGSKVKPIHLQTLEIAVDSNIPDFDYDWRIRIYTSNATYDEQNFTSIQSTFVKLADTTAVLHPDGDRVVIPTTAFGETAGTGIALGRLDRRIFYIRAAGPWLTYTTNALQQAKDQGHSGPRLTLFVGSPIVVEPTTDTTSGDNPFALPSNVNHASKGGFDDPTQAFPTTLDTSISLVFSGRVHLQYERDVCLNRNDDNNDNDHTIEPPSPLTTTTSLELVSLVNATLAAADYRRVEQAVNEKVDEWLASNSLLQPYIQSSRLNMPESSKALFRPFVGQCRGWTACQFLIVKLVLEHDETLSPGIIESQFFALPSVWFDQAIRPSLPATVGAVDASYQTVQAPFQVTLQGVTSPLDTMQQEFLIHHLIGFWNARLPALYSQVFGMSVDTQVVVNNNNQKDGASLQVSGMVTGGHSVLQELGEFANSLTALFSNTEHSRYLVQSLHYDSLLPGPLAQHNRANVFAALQSIEAVVEGTTTLAGSDGGGTPGSPTTDGSTNPSSEDSTKSGILDTFEWWMWVLCGGGLGLVLLAVWLVLYCCWWNNAPGKRPSAAARGTGHAPHEQPLGGNNAAKHNQNHPKHLRRGLTTASSTTIPDSTPSAEYNFASTLALPLPVKQREESDHALNQFVQDQQAQQSMSMVPVSAIAVTAPFGHTRPQPARNGVYDTEVPSNQPTASPPGQFSNNNRATPMNSPSPPPGVALAPGSTMTTTFGDRGLSPQGPQLQSPQVAPVRNNRPPLQQQQSIPVPPLLRQQTSSMRQGPCVQPQAPTTTQSWIVNHSPNTGNPPQQPTPSDQTTPTNTSPRKKFPTWLTTGVFGSNASSSSSPTRPTAAVQTPSPQSPVRHNAPLPASTVMPPPPLSSSYTPRTNPMTGPQAPQSSAASSPRQQQQQSVRNPQQPQGIRPVGAPLSTTTTPFSPTNPPPHPAVTPDSPELAQGGGGSPRSPVSAGRRLRPLASYHLGSISAVGGQSQSPQVIPLSPQPASPRMTLTASPVPPTDKTDPSSQQRQSGTPPNTTTVPPTQLSPSRSSPPVVVGSQRRSSGVYENTLPSKPIMNIRGSMVQQARPVPQQQQPPAVQHQPGQQQPSPSRSPPAVVGSQRRVSGVYETTAPSKPIMNIRGSMVQPAAPPPVQSVPPEAGAPPVVVGSQRRVSGVYETTTPSKPIMNIRGSMVDPASTPPVQSAPQVTSPPPVIVGSQCRISGVYETTTPSKPIMNIRGSMVQQAPQPVQPQPVPPQLVQPQGQPQPTTMATSSSPPPETTSRQPPVVE